MDTEDEKRVPLLNPGDDLKDTYEIIKRIGMGGMGEVYAARHKFTNRKLAVKIIRPPKKEDARRMSESFIVETKLLAQLSGHPNIVEVTDAGYAEGLGYPFMVMPLLEGTTLSKYLERQARLGRRWLIWLEARQFAEQIANALSDAHSHDIIHRDVKPDNIFILLPRDGSRTAKLMDFGIAKVLGPELQTATVLGTPSYAAPEQLGDEFRDVAFKAKGIVIDRYVSAQSDVWAFAIVVCEMLTGIGPRILWDANKTGQLLANALWGDRRPLRQIAPRVADLVPPAFDEWLLRALRHNAAERWPSVAAAFEALCDLMDPFEQVQPTPENPYIPAHARPRAPTASTRRGPVVAPTALMPPAALPPSATDAPHPGGALIEERAVVGNTLEGHTTSPPVRSHRTRWLAAGFVGLSALVAGAVVVSRSPTTVAVSAQAGAIRLSMPDTALEPPAASVATPHASASPSSSAPVAQGDTAPAPRPAWRPPPPPPPPAPAPTYNRADELDFSLD